MKIENIAECLYESLKTLVPKANCSCHINPPCGDCVEYSEARESLLYYEQYQKENDTH